MAQGLDQGLRLLPRRRAIFFGYWELGAYGLAVLEAPSVIEFFLDMKTAGRPQPWILIIGFGDGVTNQFLADEILRSCQENCDHLLVVPRRCQKMSKLLRMIFRQFSLYRTESVDLMADNRILNLCARPFLSAAVARKVYVELFSEGCTKIEIFRRFESMGIRLDRPIVCIAVRDKDFAHKMQQKTGSVDYAQGAISQHFRNSAIGDYLPAIERLVIEGYQVLRVGDGPPIAPLTAHSKNLSKVIDYAHSPSRTSLTDIALFMHVQFCIFGGLSGIMSLAQIFSKPFLVCNAIPIWGLDAPKDIVRIFAPKILYCRRRMEFLPLSETVSKQWYTGEIYEDNDILLVNNPPELIENMVGEFLTEVLSPGPRGSNAPEQVVFGDLYRQYVSGHHLLERRGEMILSDDALERARNTPFAKVSTEFLRWYPEWLK